MNITKSLAYSELLVCPEVGKIWLNSDTCILRISDINFINSIEKFTSIDLCLDNDSLRATMYDKVGNQKESELSKFILKLIPYLFSKIIDKDEEGQNKFLDDILEVIKLKGM